MSGAATELDVLADGTAIESLVSERTRQVSLRTCADPELHRLETQRVFGRAWLFVGHEGEIPAPGDFVSRYMGEDSVIVSRGSDGEIRALLNVCRHRGAKVCRVDAGNTRTFECPYHGWTYGRNGELIGVPAEKYMYGDELRKGDLGLRHARVETYNGLIFATWDHARPPLRDYLGGWAPILDMMYRRTDGGTIVLGAPQRWLVKANWKLACEQFAGDAYHVGSTHRSLAQIGFGPSTAEYSEHPTWDLFARYAYDYEEVVARDGRLMPPGLTPALFPEVERNLNANQVELLRTGLGPGAHLIFPNFAGIFTPQPALDGKLSASMAFRTFNPRGVDLLEVTSWTVAERDDTPENKRLISKTTAQNLGPAGLIEQDDSEMWVSIQQNLAGGVGYEQHLDYSSSKKKTGAPGWSDDRQWEFWRRWVGFMTEGRSGIAPNEGYGTIDRPAGTGGRQLISPA